jgi:hypothetical protein
MFDAIRATSIAFIASTPTFSVELPVLLTNSYYLELDPAFSMAAM